MNETIHIHDDAAAYALRALPDVERIAVEAHAQRCPPCAQELRAASDAAHMVAWLAQPQAPPAWCKSSVQKRIENDVFLHKPTPRRAGLPRLATLLPVAAVLTLFTLWNVRLQQTTSTATQQAVDAQRQVVTLQGTLERQSAQVISLQATMEQNTAAQALLVSSQATRPLSPRGSTTAKTKAMMHMTPGERAGVIMIQNLPMPPAGMVYQVWVTSPQVEQPCETFRPDEDTMLVIVHAPQSLDSYNWIMVTLEEGRGSEKPSDDMVLWGEF